VSVASSRHGKPRSDNAEIFAVGIVSAALCLKAVNENLVPEKGVVQCVLLPLSSTNWFLMFVVVGGSVERETRSPPV
jgi:hypothetical protein